MYTVNWLTRRDPLIKLQFSWTEDSIWSLLKIALAVIETKVSDKLLAEREVISIANSGPSSSVS